MGGGVLLQQWAGGKMVEWGVGVGVMGQRTSAWPAVVPTRPRTRSVVLTCAPTHPPTHPPQVIIMTSNIGSATILESMETDPSGMRDKVTQQVGA